MAIRTTHQRCCDRCDASIGEPLDTEPTDDDDGADPLVSLEAQPFGIKLKVMRDLCDPCKKVIPTLLDQVVSVVAPKKKGAKKKTKGTTK